MQSPDIKGLKREGISIEVCLAYCSLDVPYRLQTIFVIAYTQKAPGFLELMNFYFVFALLSIFSELPCDSFFFFSVLIRFAFFFFFNKIIFCDNWRITALVICVLVVVDFGNHKTQISLSSGFIYPPLSQFVADLIGSPVVSYF